MFNAQEAAVVEVCERLAGKADTEGVDALTPVQRTALLPWWAKGIVDNGGFQYFYEGAWNAEEVAAAFAEIGLPEAAEAYRQTRAVFPADRRLEEQDYRVQWMSDNAAAIEAAFAAADGVIWDLTDPLFEALARYINAHERELTGAHLH
jgi:hypothetical protein